MIYLAKDGEFMKIGLAATRVSLRYRMDTFRVGNPRELEFRLLSETGARAEEKALHLKMAEHRVRGEWFRVNSALLALWESAEPLVNRSPRGRPQTTRLAAISWLEDLLLLGPVLASEIRREGARRGFSGKTLGRAADAIGVKRPTAGLNSQTIVWSL